MTAITISALTSFFSGEPKSIHRGENHYKSDHRESFQYSTGMIRGSVHARMKDKSYKVTVSETQWETFVGERSNSQRKSLPCEMSAKVG